MLAILSVVAGMLMNGWIQGWLESSTGQHAHETPLLNFTPVGLLTLGVVAIGDFAGPRVTHRGEHDESCIRFRDASHLTCDKLQRLLFVGAFQQGRCDSARCRDPLRTGIGLGVEARVLHGDGGGMCEQLNVLAVLVREASRLV